MIPPHWRPALAGMACLGLGAGLMGIYGFFVEPLSAEFEVGVATLNIGPVALLLVPGLVAPLVGRLADRLPIRRIMIAGISLAMLGLVLASRAAELWQAGAAFLLFALGLTCYGPAVVNALLVKLYPGHEARALSLAAIGISIAAAVLPPAIGFLLGVLDWRTALAGIALVLWLLLLGAILAGIPADAGRVAAGERQVAPQGLFRQRVFWLIGCCVALGFNHSIVMAVCFPPLFINEGYTVQQAGLFVAFAGLCGLAGKACLAWLGDRAGPRAPRLALGLLLVQAAGCLVLLAGDSTASVLLALLMLGFGGGAFIPMHPFLNSRYYPADVIGQVNGAQMPLFLPLGLVGAPLAGYVFDRTGSYDLVLVGLSGILLVAALLALALPASQPGRAAVTAA